MYQELFELHEQLLKALANSRRLEIVHLLRDQALSVTDIHTMLDLPQANISQHLMVLKEAGIVTAKKDGKQIFYHLTHPNIIQASDLMREMLLDQHQEQKLADVLTLRMKELVPLVHDPVCGMRVSPKTAGFSADYAGHTYYFCASGCSSAFHKNPNKYQTKEGL
ncbi:MAG TPA: metalloregulator ArsR/SmtB family transcription factor [Patescibacteria group bacterium]|jgi:ArsR family transcriptional regulator